MRRFWKLFGILFRAEWQLTEWTITGNYWDNSKTLLCDIDFVDTSRCLRVDMILILFAYDAGMIDLEW